MGPGPWRWTQINQGELGGSFGVHFWVSISLQSVLLVTKKAFQEPQEELMSNRDKIFRIIFIQNNDYI